MAADRDTTRIVRSWLQTDEHESAERVLDNVFDLLDTTPQRRSWWPARRFGQMNSFAKFAIAVAAVVVVAIVGVNMMAKTGGDVGVPATASPSPSPSASPSASVEPEPSSQVGALPNTGRLDPGRYSIGLDGIAFSIELAANDWNSSQGALPGGGNLVKGVRGLGQPDSAWMLIWSIDGVYTDPCGNVAGPVLSPSAADLGAAVAALPGTEVVTAPTDVTVGGRAAKHVAIRIPENIPCAPTSFNLWYADATCDGSNPCGRWVTAIGETNRIWIVEVDGKHIWIEVETYAGATPALEQEIQAIIDSVQFE